MLQERSRLTCVCLGILALTAMTTANNDCPPIFQPHETILFQGDSITDGNRGRNTDPNHILGHGYVFTIAAQYGASYPALGLTFVNRGISGNTVPDLAARWETDTLAIKPDVLSILIGINDIAKETFTAAKTEEAYDRLLADTRRALPNVKFVLCDPFTMSMGERDTEYPRRKKAVGQLAEVVTRLAAKYNAPIVHFQRVFNEALKRAPVEHWIWDGIHPTYSGHQLMADEWIRAYNDFYVSPLQDPLRNSAIAPEVNFERDSYDWLHRHADILAAQANTQPDVVMIGDSITHFWAGDPKANTSNGGPSWQETFKGLKVLNMGCGWDRTQNVLWRLQHGEFVGLKPSTIILNIGTNNLVGDDTARTNTPEEVAEGILAIVKVLRERSPESRVFVMGVFPRGFDKGNPLDLLISRLNKILAKSLAGLPQVKLLDIGAKFREPDGSISPLTLSDGTHPTDRGYAIWGKALREAGALPKGKE